jgi:hypothetical protein
MYSVMNYWRNTLPSKMSVNAFPGNGFVLNNGRIVERRCSLCGLFRGYVTREIGSGCTRGLNLVAVRHTTVQMTRLPL